MYELDFDHTIAMGEAALETARAIGDRPLIAVGACILSLGNAAAGRIPPAREHLEVALAEIERLTDAELAPRVDLFYYLGWTLNYLERYDDAIAYVDRGIAIARATGEGRRLVPMMLVKGFPYEMQGRMAEARELCETAVEATRLSASPHELYWALFELAWAHYYSGDPDSAITACDESIRVDPRMGGATMPSAGGGPGWALGVALFSRGDVEQGEKIMRGLGSDDLPHKIPVEKCFDWEMLTLVELGKGRLDHADAIARRAEEHAATLDVNLPAAIAARTRAAVLMASGKPAEAARAAALSVERAAAAGARLQAALSRGFEGQALAAAGEREQAIAALRAAERELDECGCIRPRDELRRDLRKLGARAEVRGPATPDDSGTTSLTDRERGIAELVTARKTNKEIAAELFLSTKTVETHLRNIFVKLGVSSRVDVARVIERERSGGG
jgi:DNA-binding NarL/FixJ family response regulator